LFFRNICGYVENILERLPNYRDNAVPAHCIYNDSIFELQLFDPYPDEYAPMREVWPRPKQGYILVYSIPNRNRFDAVPNCYVQILIELRHYRIRNSFMLVVRNFFNSSDANKGFTTRSSKEDTAQLYSALFGSCCSEDKYPAVIVETKQIWSQREQSPHKKAKN